MSEEKHTPGPWRLEKRQIVSVCQSHNDCEVEVAELRFDEWDAETEADANLIAAAPIMYEAIANIVENCKWCQYELKGVGGCNLDHKRLQAAIKAAKGEAHV